MSNFRSMLVADKDIVVLSCCSPKGGNRMWDGYYWETAAVVFFGYLENDWLTVIDAVCHQFFFGIAFIAFVFKLHDFFLNSSFFKLFTFVPYGLNFSISFMQWLWCISDVDSFNNIEFILTLLKNHSSRYFYIGLSWKIISTSLHLLLFGSWFLWASCVCGKFRSPVPLPECLAWSDDAVPSA